MVASDKFIENIIGDFQRATEANLLAPGRRGSLVEITTDLADEVMLTGDLHGHRRNFNLLRKRADLAGHPRRRIVLQEACHGGMSYPDSGGCMSHTVVEDIARLKVEFPDQVDFMLGNHELSEIGDFAISKNGQMLNLLFRLGMQQMYGDRADEVRQAMITFLRTCPIAIRIGQSLLVTHSIPNSCDSRGFDASLFARPLADDDFFERGPLFRLVWGRDYRQENADAFAELTGAEVLVNGHEPCEAGHSEPNSRQIILDCCTGTPCYLTVPVGETLTQEQLVARIEALEV